MGTAINKTWYPSYPIKKGTDWGGSTGHKLTFSSDISSVVFTLEIKNRKGTELLLTLTESSGITHSGTYDIYIAIGNITTAALPSGGVKCELYGTSGGVVTHWMNIETEVTE